MNSVEPVLMIQESLLRELATARERNDPCVLATVAAVRGSVPRAAGAKALFYPDGRLSGTLGGGRFEALAAEDARIALSERRLLLRTYPLHERSPDSFGAICGGEVTVLFEPQGFRESMVVVGAGHCGCALSRLARECGWHVTLVDDRTELLAQGDAHVRYPGPVPEFLAAHPWRGDVALVLVSRNFERDREALAAVVGRPGPGYIGMIGSVQKVERVFADLRARGIPQEALAGVHAPIGLDLGADSPAEIAVSILAEVAQVLRGTSGRSLRDRKRR